MAETIAVIGTAASILSLLETLGTVIASINKLRHKWKGADLIHHCLVSQLIALKAALQNIREWADDIADTDHQLVMDLDDSLVCCKRLISEIERGISKLHQTRYHVLTLNSKMKIVFGNRSLDDLQKMIGRQTSALNLVLTAYSWYVTPANR